MSHVILLRTSRLFLFDGIGRPLSTCRLEFSGMYARASVSEWMSSFILPEPLRKRDVDKNGLPKEYNLTAFRAVKAYS